MKKRSKYKPKGVFPDPLGFAVNSARRLAEAFPEYVTELKIKNHASMLALTRGEATKADMNNLIQMYNVMDGFRVTGVTGIEADLNEAGMALTAIAERGKYLGTGPEIKALNTLIDYHDELFEHITTRQLHMAVNKVTATIRAGKARRLKE